MRVVVKTANRSVSTAVSRHRSLATIINAKGKYMEDNRLKFEQTEKERIKELENQVITEQLKNKQLQLDVDRVVDENIDLKSKLASHHKTNYRQRYNQLKDKIKILAYGVYIEDGRQENNDEQKDNMQAASQSGSELL